VPAHTPARPPTRSLATVAVAGCVVALAACGGGDGSSPPATTATTAVIDPGDGGRYEPDIDPAAFAGPVDNPYMPLLPGSRWVYEGTTEDGVERIEVVVTEERRPVMGIDAVVVRDTVTLDGEVTEDTFDWFAQDGEGNVWYLGEETAEYESGQVTSTAGSWEAGVDGALPGIVMPAEPEVGQAFRQEFYEGQAEDMAEVLRLDGRETVAGRVYDGLVVTEDWNPFEPDVVEEKSYAPGVGMVLEVKTVGGDERVELIEFVPGA
jgi:hypothetical protein